MAISGAPVWRIERFDAIDSTNEEIRRRAEAGAAEGLVVTAASQSQGRGRRGRGWESPIGNLYASVLLRPKCPAQEAATLSFLAPLAVIEALDLAAPHLSAQLACKWPNDVLLGGAKISGILLESRADGAAGGVEHVIVGMGVNLAHHPADTPYPATDLAAQGTRIEPAPFLDWLLARFGYWYGRWQAEGFGPVREAWLGRAYQIGQGVIVRLPDRELTGRFVALDATGGLDLELPDGSRRTISAGDVFPIAS